MPHERRPWARLQPRPLVLAAPALAADQVLLQPQDRGQPLVAQKLRPEPLRELHLPPLLDQPQLPPSEVATLLWPHPLLEEVQSGGGASSARARRHGPASPSCRRARAASAAGGRRSGPPTPAGTGPPGASTLSSSSAWRVAPARPDPSTGPCSSWAASR
ncbi:hypothetical protein F6B41_23470 [Microbacterium lushaniae]|nr:hypothetical protein F6B41_23470 [Microbacterium lushaniae]